MNYNEFLYRFVTSNQYSPLEAGEFIAGKNGLYSEPETSFRNISHWLVLFSEVLRADHCQIIEEYLQKGFNELQTGFVGRKTYPARDSTKDVSNGLIGTAWIIEGLALLASLDDMFTKEKREAYDIVKELTSAYPWDQKASLWPSVVEPDGTLRGIDRTFNHQLWMAASFAQAGTVWGDEALISKATSFVEQLNKFMKLNAEGLVYHTLGIYPHYHRTFLKRLLSSQYRQDMRLKEYGYHSFNLLGLVRIYRAHKNERLLSAIAKLVKPCKHELFWGMQQNNDYGSTYNPVGIEVAVAASYLGDEDLVIKGLNYHFSNYYDHSKGCFAGGNDVVTLNARMYEICYLDSLIKNKLNYCDSTNMWSLGS